MITYDLVTEWFFDEPVEKVWHELNDLRSFPQWWRDWKQVDVHGDEVQVDTLVDCAVKGDLPYTLRFQLLINRNDPPFLNEHSATGGLAGKGRWQLAESAGGTAVTHEWRVGATNPLLNFFSRFSFANAMMTKNHAGIMARGYEGLKARLAAVPEVVQ